MDQDRPTAELDNTAAPDPIHPAVRQVLQYFSYAHLPPHLQDISKPICDLAYAMALQLPQSPEVAVGIRKLLEAKDCFVRARLP